MPYQYLFEELEWTTVDKAKMSNFEPRFLETLIRNHPSQVEDAYEDAITDFLADPEMFELRMNPWDLLGGGKT